MAGQKQGLFTPQEVKVVWKLAADKLPIPVLLKPIANLFIPNMLDNLDNKVGDRIPEPWQTHLENVITMVVTALEDKEITEQEAKDIAVYCAMVIDEKVDVPLLDDDTEAVVFLETFKLLVALIYGAVK